jgi:hypothetical protein
MPDLSNIKALARRALMPSAETASDIQGCQLTTVPVSPILGLL